ncbi:MAG: hypothetical protein MZV70_33380 [Desulfobacterales bacterium]|nr:hypothetical protein [Desulfobacterales bacterium]
MKHESPRGLIGGNPSPACESLSFFLLGPSPAAKTSLTTPDDATTSSKARFTRQKMKTRAPGNSRHRLGDLAETVLNV